MPGDNVFGTQASQLEAARQEEEQRGSDVDTALLAEQTDAGGLDVAGDNVFGTQASQQEAARETASE